MEPHDRVASLTLAVCAAAAVLASMVLPWWVLEARAPQYGQRVLLVEVGPTEVRGDLFELDTLGHYVGIAPVKEMAKLERSAGAPGLMLAAACVLVVPWIGRRSLRLLAILPVLLLPFVFLVDLHYWTNRSMNDRDPEAALRIPRADPRLVGEYAVGQFKMKGELGGGIVVSGLAGLMALGLAFSAPLGRRERRRSPVASAAAAGAALAIAVVLAGGPARAAVHEVRPGDSLARTLEGAGDGDEVVLLPGVHHGPVVVDRPLQLVGRAGAVLDGGGRGTILRVRAGARGARIAGLALRGSGDNYTAEDAGIRLEAHDVRIEDVRLDDVLFGIFALEADRCAIERTSVVGKPLPVTRRGDGIRLWASHGCRVIGNVMRQSRDLVIWYSRDTLVEDNVVTHSRYGLHYMYSDRNVFRRNRFEWNEVGAAIMYSKGVTLEDNDFSHSHGPAAYGLLLKDSDDVVIAGNRFVENDLGLFFDGAPQSRGSRVDVRANVIARNDVGVALQPASRGLRFWDNAFAGNRQQVVIQGAGSAEANEWAVDGRGNYWSDAIVYDADADGISEAPFRLDSTYEALADRHPVLAFFAGTPGAEAIDAAARAFPLFAPRPRLIDPHPLMSPPAGARGGGGGGGPIAATGAALLGVAALGFAAARRTS
jgi:nitrous oxidase accessory protein